MRLTKKALLLLYSPSKPSALLWGTKVPVVANIARTQWHLRLVTYDKINEKWRHLSPFFIYPV